MFQISFKSLFEQILAKMSTQEVQTKVTDKKARQKQREERKKIQMRYINKFQEGLPEYTQWEYTKQAMSAFFLFSM